MQKLNFISGPFTPLEIAIALAIVAWLAAIAFPLLLPGRPLDAPVEKKEVKGAPEKPPVPGRAEAPQLNFVSPSQFLRVKVFANKYGIVVRRADDWTIEAIGGASPEQRKDLADNFPGVRFRFVTEPSAPPP